MRQGARYTRKGSCPAAVLSTCLSLVDGTLELGFYLPGSVEAGAALWRWEATDERDTLPFVTFLTYWARAENTIRRGSHGLVHETALAPHFKRRLEESFDATAGLAKRELVGFRREASKADAERSNLVWINNVRRFQGAFHNSSFLRN